MNAHVSTRVAGAIALFALAALPVAARAATALDPPIAAVASVISEPELRPIDCIVGRQSSYEPGEWDYNWNGHHEPDPNLHTWQPRRYCEVAQAGSAFVGRQSCYEPGEWDYNWSGHHEPDPNLHTWQPWRYCEVIQAGRTSSGRQTSYEPGEWDYNWSGHHEPDPNLHR